MADLFDMNVAGYGFHITGHLLAVIALVIACLAITGYISFRNDSIPTSALDDGGPGDSLNIPGNLTVGGQIDHGATGFREKVYSFDYTNLDPITGNGDSIGPIATGFSAGHFVTFTTVEIRTGEALAADAGAVVFEITSAANAAIDGTPPNGSAVTGAATLAATNTAGSSAASPTATNGFTAANNTLCITLATAGNSAIAATAHIRVTAKVTAMPGSPALP